MLLKQRGSENFPPVTPPPCYYYLIFHYYLHFLISQIGHYCCSDVQKLIFFLHSICSCIIHPSTSWDLPPDSQPRVPSLPSLPITPPAHSTAPTGLPHARQLLSSCPIYFSSACLSFLYAIWLTVPLLYYFLLSAFLNLNVNFKQIGSFVCFVLWSTPCT